jgi:hypothetical protein
MNDDERQAEDAERRARQEVHEGTYDVPKDVLFIDFLDHYLVWAREHRKGSQTWSFK